MKQKHFIFDFDGVLVDSMEIWAGTHIRMLRKCGVPVPENYVQTITPLGNEGAALYSFSLGIDISLERYMKELNAALIKQYKSRVKLKDNVQSSLSRLRDMGGQLHVLTASPHTYVDPCLKRLGIEHFFKNIWTIDDFGTGKGDKLIYEKTVKRLNADASDCTMIDDNLLALTAARRAGLKTVAVYDKSSRKAEAAIRQTADKYVYDLSEIETTAKK